MLLVEVFNDNDRLVLVVVPPFVAHLEVCVWVVGASFIRFPGSGSSMVPEVLGGGIGQLARIKEVVVMRLYQALTIEPHAFGDIFIAAFFSGVADVPPSFFFVFSLLFGKHGGDATFCDVTIFLTVGDVLFGELSLFNVAMGELFADGGMGKATCKFDIALQVGGPLFPYLFPIEHIDAWDSVDSGMEFRVITIVVEREGIITGFLIFFFF